MGFFSAIKKNLNHGGVKLTLQIPLEISAAEPSLSGQLNMVADQQQQINKVTVKLIRTHYENINTGMQGDAQSTPIRNEYVLGSFVKEEPFMLQANMPVSLPVYIPFQASAELPASIPGYEPVTEVLDNLQKFDNFNNNERYTYEVVAVADVEGVTLDPADRKSIELRGGNQF